MLSEHALQLLWNLTGPHATRCAFTGAELDAAHELRAFAQAEAARRARPSVAAVGEADDPTDRA